MSHHMSSDHVTPVYTKTTTAEAVILLVLYYYQSNVPYCILYFWINMAAAFMCLLHSSWLSSFWLPHIVFGILIYSNASYLSPQSQLFQKKQPCFLFYEGYIQQIQEGFQIVCLAEEVGGFSQHIKDFIFCPDMIITRTGGYESFGSE